MKNREDLEQSEVVRRRLDAGPHHEAADGQVVELCNEGQSFRYRNKEQ